MRTVSVSATGVVEAEPDAAAISTGVVSEADTARAALDANSAQMAKLIEGLKAAGIAQKDIQTTSFNVSPRYQHFQDGKPPVINGYQVTNQIRIEVRALDRLGEIMDAAVKLGANQVGGIDFHISKAEKLKDEARKRAMANAMQRAKLYAASAGAEIGEVIAIAEDMAPAHSRPMSMGGRVAVAAGAVPVERGTQEIEVRVNVSWALK